MMSGSEALYERLNILNIWVDAVDRNLAIRRVHDFLQSQDGPHVVFASNPEKNFSVPKDNALYSVYKNADLLIPDGIGMVMAARVLYGTRIQRIPGADFLCDICQLARDEGKGVFLYGSRDEVNALAEEKLKDLYPGIRIVGRSHGYVAPEQMPDLIDRINRSGADILFIALGSPRQEKWYGEHRDALQHVKVCQGIGGSLDAIAGTVKRAPEFWRRHSLEWLYRLMTEPTRLKRQRVLPLFVVLVMLEKLKLMLKGRRKRPEKR